jgi:hypothetical protein
VPLSVTEEAVAVLNTPVLDLGPGFLAVAEVDGAASAGQEAPQGMIDTPGVGGLFAGYSTAVESLNGSVIPSLILAAVVAWLSVRGLDASDRKKGRR